MRLPRVARTIALLAIVQSLTENDVEVLVASLDDHHLHLLGKFANHDPRVKLGCAKLRPTQKVKEYSKAHGSAVGPVIKLADGEGIWAKRSKAEPVRDKSHQVNLCAYIAKHGSKGAVVFIRPSIERALQRMNKLPQTKDPRQSRGLS